MSRLAVVNVMWMCGIMRWVTVRCRGSRGSGCRSHHGSHRASQASEAKVNAFNGPLKHSGVPALPTCRVSHSAHAPWRRLEVRLRVLGRCRLGGRANPHHPLRPMQPPRGVYSLLAIHVRVSKCGPSTRAGLGIRTTTHAVHRNRGGGAHHCLYTMPWHRIPAASSLTGRGRHRRHSSPPSSRWDAHSSWRDAPS